MEVGEQRSELNSLTRLLCLLFGPEQEEKDAKSSGMPVACEALAQGES